MSSFLKCASACGLLVMLAGNGTLNAAPPGFLEGHLAIIGLKESAGVELAEDGQSNRAAEAYKKYPLVVLSQDGSKEIARFTADVTADDEGGYRVELPPGSYILDVKDRVEKRLRAQPQSFKVESNQTVRVDMLISK